MLIGKKIDYSKIKKKKKFFFGNLENIKYFLKRNIFMLG
jgi:hypothetical protein